MTPYTEADTERFYDTEDALYRSFWDRQGSLHWGYFEAGARPPASAFVDACARWNARMLAQSGIDAHARVLDLGCGNGTTALWLAAETGCEVVGVDLSGVRVANARAAAGAHRVQFDKASATALPYEDGAFTHVWSQATLYHVHDRSAALAELHRVLQDGGSIVFDDLVTPRQPVGDRARRFVYDRLLFAPTYSHDGYVEALAAQGLLVCREEDLSPHLRTSYELLCERATSHYPELAAAYVEMCGAIDRGELGWSFFVADKIADPLSWVYTSSRRPLAEKYDAWARTYDRDLGQSYGACPAAAAEALATAVADRGARILDAGCGTGLTGEALAANGYANLVGLDASAGMLRMAAAKGVYRTLLQANLERPEALEEAGRFDAVVATGVFTFAHAAPSALHALDRALAPGGIVAITARQDYLAATPAFLETCATLGWQIAARREIVIFGNEPMDVLTFRRGSR